MDDVDPLTLPEHLAQPLEGEPLVHYQVLEQLRALEQDAKPRRGDDTTEQAIERLDGARIIHRRRKRRHIGLMLLSLLLVALGIAWEAWSALPLAAKLPHLPDFVRNAATARVHELAGPDAFFDPAWKSDDDWLKGTEQAWLEHPADPEYYYFRSSLTATFRNQLPPDYDETVRRLDPTNAAWDLLRADVLAGRAIDPKTRIPDPALAAQVLAALEAAAQKPRLDDYHQELARIYATSYRPRSIYERDLLLFHLGDSTSFLLHPFNRLLYPIHVEMKRSESDPAASAASFRLFQKLLYRSALAGDYMAESFVKNMADRADARGLSYDAARLRRFREMCEAAPYGSDPLMDSAWQPASAVMTARLFFLALAALLLILAWLLRLRFRPARGSVNRAALCLEPLLTSQRPIPLRTLISLIAVPLIVGPVFLFCTRDADGLIAAVPFILILDFIILLQGMRIQIFRRLGCMGLRPLRLRSETWNIAIIFILVAATLFVLGGGRWDGSNPMLLAVAALTCLVTLWISASAVLGYSSYRSSLRHNLLARRMMTAIPFAVIPLILLAGALVPVERVLVSHTWDHIHAEQKEWESSLLAKNKEALHWMLRELE